MADNQGSIDRRVNRAWVCTLLRRGLALECAADRLPSSAPDPLDSFGAYLQRLRPVVLIAAGVPYAEHLVADLLIERGYATQATTLVAPLSGDIMVALPRGDDNLLLLSFYESAAVENALDLRSRLERTSHAVLIGCQRVDDLPDAFRRLVDLTVTLPGATADDVDTVFGELFGVPLPREPSGQRPRWHDVVLPTDLQQPLRLAYAADAAAAYVGARVRERQRRVSAEQAPDLAALHGLGAARDVAEDLVRDLQLAMQGTVSWAEVDRGMLIVGPPGTGKTTLARAIAKGCGVHFIATSPARWHGVELGSHLANIRATFDEARRAGAALLFVDELDGIGNRARLTDSGRSYQTKIINALLEELDGFSRRDRIVIVGATNDESQVDPALRRAGRLDQTLRVPYPNIAALAAIYSHHLARHAAAGQVASDVDVAALGALSFGLTGADVEFFVRGAARRARRRAGAGPIRQQDLIDEIMRRPRVPGSVGRIDADTLRRLAVHEAGHAVLRLLGARAGHEIGYVSIAPRSDGRVGYTAAMPDERVSATREDLLEEIRVCLAGRAAEEVMYGPDDVSDIAADGDAASDLAIATARARALHGTSGLSASAGLVWWPALPAALHGDVDRATRATLADAYRDTVRRLAERRELLARIGDRLVLDQEISGTELRRLGA